MAVKKVMDTALERWKVAEEFSQQRHEGTSLVVQIPGGADPWRCRG